MKYLAECDFDLEKENELKVLRSLTERDCFTLICEIDVCSFRGTRRKTSRRDAIEDVASHCSACDFGVERRFCRSREGGDVVFVTVRKTYHFQSCKDIMASPRQ